MTVLERGCDTSTDAPASGRNYVGLWPRFFAQLVDGVVFFVPLAAASVLAKGYRDVNLALTLIFGLALPAYVICMHATLGQTLGKMMLGIRVERSAGGSIGWYKAFLRMSVNLGLVVASLAGRTVAYLGVPPAEYALLTLKQRVQTLAAANPVEPWLRYVSVVWLVAEVLVLLTGRRKRAVHDFIAGTVVVRLSRVALPASTLEGE